LTTEDGVFRGIRAVELEDGTVRSTEKYEEYNGVQLEIRIVPVECPVGRR
jgi:hypothetical protein